MKIKQKLFFLLYSMSVGGVEKSLLGLLSTINMEDYEIHIGLLQRTGEYLNQIPQKVILHDCYVGCWNIVNTPPLITIKQLLKKCCYVEALLYMIGYTWYKLTSDLSLYYKIMLRNEPQIDIEFDEAYAYFGPSSPIEYYICNKINAKQRFGWIHFDVMQLRISELAINKTYKKFDKIYVVSETGKQKFDERFPELAHKTEVKYNIVSQEQVHSLASIGNSFNDDYCGIKILTVGRLSGEKGQDIAIEALNILINKGYNVHWYFIGDGYLKTICEDKARLLNVLDGVSFLGTIPNPYAYMRDCDIYVQPSIHEGYCISLAEALCFTAPIVATCFTGAEEQLRTHSHSIITKISPEDIADGIESFILQIQPENK